MEKRAHASYNIYEFGCGFVRKDINSYLHTKGSNLIINGMFMLEDKQHADIFSTIHHEDKSTNSHQLIKGILGGLLDSLFPSIKS